MLVIALPESLNQKNQAEFERQVVACKETLRQSSRRLVVVMADEGSPLFHRLAHFRQTDLEVEVQALEHADLQRECPFVREASVVTGGPLSGKSQQIPGIENRIALWPGLSELEFCRLCRQICRAGQVPRLVIDFGWTDADSKMSRLGMVLLPLLLFGVAGTSLVYPFCLRAPRLHSLQFELVFEVGPIKAVELLRHLPTWSNRGNPVPRQMTQVCFCHLVVFVKGRGIYAGERRCDSHSGTTSSSSWSGQPLCAAVRADSLEQGDNPEKLHIINC